MQKTINKQLLIIGGTKRNIGKTTLIEKIIQKFSSEFDIIAFKIKTIYPYDSFFHGKDRNPLAKNENFRLIEEKNKEGIEDTNRMLNAGAKKVFKLKTKANFIFDGFNEITKVGNKRTLFICESNSLRKHVIPALYLFVKEKNNNEMKPSAQEVVKFADKIILTDGKKHNFSINEIFIEDFKWELKKL